MKKLYEKYISENGMTAKISPSEITLKTYRGQQQFIFRKSTPEIVKLVADQMIAAVEISKNQKKTDFVETAKAINGCEETPRKRAW